MLNKYIYNEWKSNVLIPSTPLPRKIYLDTLLRTANNNIWHTKRRRRLKSPHVAVGGGEYLIRGRDVNNGKEYNILYINLLKYSTRRDTGFRFRCLIVGLRVVCWHVDILSRWQSEEIHLIEAKAINGMRYVWELVTTESGATFRAPIRVVVIIIIIIIFSFTRNKSHLQQQCMTTTIIIIIINQVLSRTGGGGLPRIVYLIALSKKKKKRNKSHAIVFTVSFAFCAS